jgi:hypothetical protein
MIISLRRLPNIPLAGCTEALLITDSKVVVAIVGRDFLIDVDGLESFEADDISADWHEVAIGVAVMLRGK